MYSSTVYLIYKSFKGFQKALNFKRQCIYIQTSHWFPKKLTPPKFNSSPLKNDGLGPGLFSGAELLKISGRSVFRARPLSTGCPQLIDALQRRGWEPCRSGRRRTFQPPKKKSQENAVENELVCRKFLRGFFKVCNKIYTNFVLGGFLKWWVSPTTIGFPTRNDHFGCEMGVPPFKETPI